MGDSLTLCVLFATAQIGGMFSYSGRREPMKLKGPVVLAVALDACNLKTEAK